MSDIVIHETDHIVLQKISQLAKENNVTPEEEAKSLLRWAVDHVKKIRRFEEVKPFSHVPAERKEEARAFRKRFAHMQTTDSVDLLREDRDR